jgi:hypothetical protein
MTPRKIDEALKRHAENGDNNARVLLNLRRRDPATLKAHADALARLKVTR